MLDLLISFEFVRIVGLADSNYLFYFLVGILINFIRSTMYSDDVVFMRLNFSIGVSFFLMYTLIASYYTDLAGQERYENSFVKNLIIEPVSSYTEVIVYFSITLFIGLATKLWKPPRFNEDGSTEFRLISLKYIIIQYTMTIVVRNLYIYVCIIFLLLISLDIANLQIDENFEEPGQYLKNLLIKESVYNSFFVSIVLVVLFLPVCFGAALSICYSTIYGAKIMYRNRILLRSIAQSRMRERQ